MKATSKRTVAYPAAAIVLIFVAVAVIAPEWLGEILSAANSSVINGLGWYYSLIVAGFVAFALFIAFAPYGNIHLGKDDDEATYGLFTWFAMLFAAGMGIGLVFWGVAEPLNHYAAPPPGVEGNNADLAQEAMTTTYLHWGMSAWAIYIVVGLAVAYAVHRKGRSVSLRWILEPLLGDKVKGWVGDMVDVFAIVGTLFGVATSLGFGATQFTAGLEFLGITESSMTLLLIVIGVITGMATLSVVSGLDIGIKWLSNSNMVLAAILMLAVLFLGQPLFVMREFVQTIGEYLTNFVHLSFRTMAYQGADGESWLGGWTTYYWGWWMSWSPFVGIFIARISKGRTVREFVLGVLLVPTLITFLWFAIMGGTALWQELYGGGGLIAADGSVSSVTALFQMLEAMPLAPVLVGLFLILIVVFFVTSSDSASFVVDMLASGGNPNPPVASRVFWAIMEGTIAAVLLWGGAQSGALTAGLGALQTMAILAAAPFSVIMVMSCVATVRAFHWEHRRRLRLEDAVLKREMATHVTDHVSEHFPENVVDSVSEQVTENVVGHLEEVGVISHDEASEWGSESKS